MPCVRNVLSSSSKNVGMLVANCHRKIFGKVAEIGECKGK